MGSSLSNRNTGAKAATKPVGCPSLTMPALLTKISGELSQKQHHHHQKKKHCLPQTSWTWITRTGPRPSQVLYIHSLILESSELIYVKLQNVLMTPYDIETICGGLFDLKGKSSTGYSLSGDLRSCFAHGKEPEGRMLIIRSDAFDFAGKTGGVDLSKISPFHARRRDIVYFIIVISGRGG